MRVRLVIGALAEQQADVLVRVAPPSLLHRSGNELVAAAGPEVTAACRELRRLAGPRGLRPGEAVRTSAGRLAARCLVHVVVPPYSVREQRAHLLASAYRACLACADEVGGRSVAMPGLGATVPYWPLEEATRIGLGTLYGAQTRVREVRLLLPGPAALEAFAEALVRR